MSHIFETVTGTSEALAFKFNGQFALKNYNVEIVNGNKLKVVSTTNEMFSLLEADVREVEINGMIYSDPAAAQIALTSLVYSENEPVVLTKEQYMQLSSAVQMADRGKILPDTPIPSGGWQPGWYTPGLFENEDPGTNYPNQNNLKAKKGFITKFLYSGGIWDAVVYSIPQATQFIPAFTNSTFPLISSTSNPVQKTHQGSIWELTPGATATSTDIPGSSSKWTRLGKFNFNVKKVIEEPSAPASNISSSLTQIFPIFQETIQNQYIDSISVNVGTAGILTVLKGKDIGLSTYGKSIITQVDVKVGVNVISINTFLEKDEFIGIKESGDTAVVKYLNSANVISGGANYYNGTAWVSSAIDVFGVSILTNAKDIKNPSIAPASVEAVRDVRNKMLINRFDNNLVVDGKYLSTSGVVIVGTKGLDVWSNLINVSDILQVGYKNKPIGGNTGGSDQYANFKMAWHKEDKSLISVFNITTLNGTLTKPDDAKYLSFTAKFRGFGQSYAETMIYDAQYTFNSYVAYGVTYLSKLKELSSYRTSIYGKKLTYLGDSITIGRLGAGTFTENAYPTLIGNRNSNVVQNLGVSGTHLCFYSSAATNTFIQRAKDIASDSDYIIIFGCTNDVGNSINAGVPTDYCDFGAFNSPTWQTVQNTICGNIAWLIKNITENRPGKKLMFVLPYNHSMGDETRRFAINDAIAKTCEYYSIPYLDLQKKAGFSYLRTPNQYSTLIGDGGTDTVHPNFTGQAWLSRIIEQFIIENN
ncbi:SGNH/GDSL hydrolase family protein [Chryseobacterium sp. YIM B08800]|uniref:SGNH/GDSL hydrolase family protein n=1 Tax=Chryseobacterium sp. YIM B08800 TaxID=2984136 RepID=UPI00224084D2|nr:SGNH/GDSL hydrolase family protein [Chryseobacterium sp. YIM B08800]